MYQNPQNVATLPQAAVEVRNTWPRGRLALARAWLSRPTAVLDEGLARFGPTFRLPLPFQRDALVTGDPELVRRIAADPGFLGGPGARALRGVLGDGSLITVDGAAHARQRKALAPLFRAPRLDAFDEMGREAFARALRAGTERGPSSIYAAAQHAGLEMIVAFLYGDEPEAKQAAIRAAVAALMRSFESPLFLFVEPLRMSGAGLLPWGIFQRRVAHLRALIDHDEERLALLLFGHDTTAAAFAWTAQLVCAHPEHRARAAVDPEFRFACVRESLRLRPVVAHVTRVATRRTELGAHVVEAGESVYPSAYLAHRNPGVFPEPERFVPERFLGRNEPRPSQYFPFGLGDKVCIGRALAERQMTVMLEALSQDLSYELVGDTLERPRRRLLLVVPEHGTMVDRPKPNREGKLRTRWLRAVFGLICAAGGFAAYQNLAGGVGGVCATEKVLWLTLTIAQWLVVPSLVLAERRIFGRARLWMKALLAWMLFRVPVEGVMIYVTMSWKCGYGIAHDLIAAAGLALGAATIRPRTRSERAVRWHLLALAVMFVVEAYYANRFFVEIRQAHPELYYVPNDPRFENLLMATRLGVLTFGLELLAFAFAWRRAR